MSQLHIRHIRSALENSFSGLIDLTDVEHHPEDQQQAVFLSRSLAAFVLNQVAGIDPATAAACVTDGSDDNGIDAVHVDGENRRVLVAQSKWDGDGAGSPAVADVEKFLRGFRDLSNASFDRFNAKLRQRQEELTAALDDAHMTFELLLAYTGQAELSEHAWRPVSDLLNEFNDPTDVVTFRALRQVDIWSFVSGALEGESINLEVVLKDWGLTQEPYSAYYGQVSAEDVASWWDTFGPRLFAKNLRKFIPDSEVNDAIVQTLLGEAQKFWYLNNGITVLCEKLQKKPIGGPDRRSGTFECEGVTVVNGAQTVGCIGTASAKDPEAVRIGNVHVRFISLENCPDGFATEVTRATNTQNRIVSRDFVSLDPEQERLRTELGLDGKVYAIKTGEPDPLPDSGCSVTEATIALACASEDPALAVLAKREIGRLWEDIDKAPYKQIFNGGVSGLRLWRSVEVLRAVETTLKEEQASREGRARGIAVHGNRLVLNVVFRALPVNQFQNPDLDFDNLLLDVPAETVKVLNRLTDLVDTEYPISYPASLFKNLTKCKRLRDLL